LLSLVPLTCEVGTQPTYLRCIAGILSLRAWHDASVPDDSARFANRLQILLVNLGFFVDLLGQCRNTGVTLIDSTTQLLALQAVGGLHLLATLDQHCQLSLSTRQLTLRRAHSFEP